MKRITTLRQMTYFVFAMLVATNVNAQTINNTKEALAFVLAEDRVPNSSTVKLEKLKATLSNKTKQWRFVFRDEDKQYTVTVNAKGNFKLSKGFDEAGMNPEFWASFPAPALTTTPEQMLEKAQMLINNFNTTFKAQDRAIIEFSICNPPKKGTVSKYANGCKDDKPKEAWSVVVQIESQGGKFFRSIEFLNGEPMDLSRTNVFGNW